MHGVISKFQDVVSLFKSLLTEERIKSFVTPPTTDLVHSLRQSGLEDEFVVLEEWPDVELIFGQDPDYQEIVKCLIALVRKEIQRVRAFSEVNITYGLVNKRGFVGE